MDFVKVRNVKQYLKEKGAGGISPEFIDSINEEICFKLNKAFERSQANRRTTVMKRDL